MFKNIMLGVMTVLVAGWVVIYSFPAKADRSRDSRFSYIGRAGGCDVYGYQGVFVVYGKDCDIAAR